MKKVIKFYFFILLIFLCEIVILWKICSGEIAMLFQAWKNSPFLMQIWFFSPLWLMMALFAVAIFKDIYQALKKEKKTKKGDY